MTSHEALRREIAAMDKTLKQKHRQLAAALLDHWHKAETAHERQRLQQELTAVEKSMASTKKEEI